MNPGIRPATAMNGYGLFKDPAETIFQNFLNTQLIGLSLPSEIIATLIADMYKISQCPALFC